MKCPSMAPEPFLIPDPELAVMSSGLTGEYAYVLSPIKMAIRVAAYVRGSGLHLGAECHKLCLSDSKSDLLWTNFKW